MPLLTDPPDEHYMNIACTSLGRALYVASGFEDDCRSLAFALKVRAPQPEGQSDEEFFNAVSNAVTGRLASLNNLIAKHAELPEQYAEMLHAARDARNYIAHEAATALDDFPKTQHGFDKWYEVLAEKIDDIAYGKIIVAVLLSQNVREMRPSTETISVYREKVKCWILQRDA